MSSVWRNRLEISPSLRDIRNWPNANVSALSRSSRRAYNRNRKIVSAVMSGQELSTVALETGVSSSTVYRLMDRCLGGNIAIPPPLTEGLLPYFHTKNSSRKSPLPSLNCSNGASCSFQYLIRNTPSLSESLDSIIESHLKDQIHGQNPTPKSFHAEFLRILVESGHSQDTYPFNTQTLGYESTRRYFHQRTKELRIEIERRKEVFSARMHLADLSDKRAMRCIEIDEQKFDLSSGVHIELNNELIPLRLGMITLLIAIDVDTRCILGYHIALGQHANQQDMLTLLENCTKPWEKMNLKTPGFSYEPGACFPSSDKTYPVIFSEVKLDNALAHFANSVKSALCHTHSATISFGLPGQPKTRHWVEAAFNYININLSHRFKTTTGSNVLDPKRESRKNRGKQPPVTLRIIEEALSIVLTKKNIERRSDLGGASPLELFKHHRVNNYTRYIPPADFNDRCLFVSEDIRQIYWYKGKRPHINFLGDKYHSENNELYDALSKGNKVLIKYDRRDIRKIKAFTEDGVELGSLLGSGSYLRFKHSFATRQFINKQVRHGRLKSRDPLGEYFHKLLESKGKPKDNLQIIKIYQEYSSNGEIDISITTEKEKENFEPLKKSGFEFPAWSTSIAAGKRG